MHGDERWRRRDERDGDEVVQRVVGRARQQELIRDERNGIDEERIAVGRRVHHHLGADHPGRAGAVVDHHLLAQALRKLRCGQPADDVHAPARRKRRDQAYRAGWIALRERGDSRYYRGNRQPGRQDAPAFVHGSLAVRLWTLPSFMVSASREASWRILTSRVGSPSTTSRSARYPALIWPSLSPRPMSSPPSLVAATSASTGV